MINQPVGYLWLYHHYNLKSYKLTHLSYIGSRDKIELSHDGNVEQVFSSKYAPEKDTPIHHLEFSLKYNNLSLEFLKAVFEKLPEEELIAYIDRKPFGKYTRRIGYLYEWLTGKRVSVKQTVIGNYVDLLDKNSYITGSTIKNLRWRINDNLLGNQEFCPIIRRTNELNSVFETDLKAQIEALKRDYSPEIFHRAAQYLYNKETKSSYAIENEKPSTGRMNRFIALLTKAGTQPTDELLDEVNLTYLQNAIVDPRYAVKGFRDFQNYIGETGFRYEEIIHYICPPPQYLISLMQGLRNSYSRTTTIPASAQAAIMAFGFVFIHPFDDGNGRLHRFLIHDILTRANIVQEGIIIPVSAHMLNHKREYDHALENYSKPLMLRVKYIKTVDGEIKVINPEEVESYFRFPDLTVQTLYLAQTINATIAEDMNSELQFLQHYDELKRALQEIVDMPDKYLNQCIIFLHQNNGIFPNRRKKQFDAIIDNEFLAMENAYKEIFES